MDAKPLISIIIPVYNAAPYLAACVGSVLAQEDENWELILVDDGSTDGSGLLCDRMAAGHDRIRVIHQKNAGLSAARNAGLDEAQGEYILFMDSDDAWEKGMLKALREKAQASGADMVLFPLAYVDEAGRPLPAPSLDGEEATTGRELLHKLVCAGNVQYVTAVNRLYGASLWQDYRFPPGRFHEDEFTAHHLYGAARKAALITQPAYLYFQRGSGITANPSPKRKLDRVAALLDRDRLLEKLEEKALQPINIKSALDWYLALLGEHPLKELKALPDFKDIRKELKRAAGQSGLKLYPGHRLALGWPGLWQKTHPVKGA